MPDQGNLLPPNGRDERAQGFDKGVNRGWYQIGWPKTRSVPGDRPVLPAEVLELERPGPGTAKQAVQENDRPALPARTERQPPMRQFRDLQWRTNRHGAGSAQTHVKISPVNQSGAARPDRLTLATLPQTFQVAFIR